MQKAVIFDLDGVVRDCTHRLHLIMENPKKWDEFHLACDKDTPIRWSSDLIKWIVSSNVENDISDMKEEIVKIIFVTGSSDISRQKTIEWLDFHLGLNYVRDIFNPLVHEYELYMRQHGEHIDDYLLKKEIYLKHIKGMYDVIFVAEDRKRVADMYRSLGLKVLHCEEGNF